MFRAEEMEAIVPPFVQASLIDGYLWGAPTVDSQQGSIALIASLLKTTYFALRLFDELSQSLPEASVILVPATLSLDHGGKLELVNEIEAALPSVLIDFFAWVPAGWAYYGIGTTPMATVGRVLYPVISARTDPEVLPETKGAIFGTSTLDPLLVPGSGPGAYGGMGASIAELIGDHRPAAQRKVSDWDTRPRPFSKSTFSQSRPWTRGRYVSLPRISLALTEPDENGRPGFSEDISVISMLVSDALADMNSERHVVELAKTRIGFYEPNPSDLTANEPQSVVLREIVAAETEYSTAQSRALRDGLLNQDWARAIERNLEDEHSQMKSAATMEVAMFFVGAAAAGALGAAGGQATGASVGSSLIESGRLAVQNTAMAIDQALSSARSEQLSVSIEIGGQESQITAANFEELRTKLRNLYLDSGLASQSAGGAR